jgi:hypothetical protein
MSDALDAVREYLIEASENGYQPSIDDALRALDAAESELSNARARIAELESRNGAVTFKGNVTARGQELNEAAPGLRGVSTARGGDSMKSARELAGEVHNACYLERRAAAAALIEHDRREVIEACAERLRAAGMRGAAAALMRLAVDGVEKP